MKLGPPHESSAGRPEFVLGRGMRFRLSNKAYGKLRFPTDLKNIVIGNTANSECRATLRYHRRQIVRTLGWIGLALLACPRVVIGEVEQEWPMRRHDPSHASVTQCDVKPPVGTRWSVSVPKQWRFGDHCPLVFSHKVFAFADGAYKSVVLCLDADSGKQLWLRKFASESAPRALVEAIGDSETDRLFVLTKVPRPRISALSAADGSTIWSRDVGAGANGLTLWDRQLFVSEGSQGKKMAHVALSAETGRVIWRTVLEEPAARYPLYGAGAPAVAAGLAVFDSNGNALFGRDPGTGALLWRYEPTHGTPERPFGPHVPAITNIALSEGRLIFRNGGSIYSLHTSDVTQGPRGDYFIGPFRAAVAGGRIFCQWRHNFIVGMDLATMAKLWVRRAKVIGFPASSPDLVWVSTRRNSYQRHDIASLRAFDSDGRLVCFTPGLFAEPAIAYGRIYLAGSGHVCCLEHDAKAPPFRNLRIARVGKWLTRGMSSLQLINTGLATEHEIEVVVDITPVQTEDKKTQRLSRQRFRIAELRPAEQVVLAFGVPGKVAEPRHLYVFCFIARPIDQYRGDSHLATVVS